MNETPHNDIARLPAQTKRISAIITILFFCAITSTVLVSSWIITFLFTKNLNQESFTPQDSPPLAIIKNTGALILSSSSPSLFLSSEGSFDPDGGLLTYEWAITAGPTTAHITPPFIVSHDAYYTAHTSLLASSGIWIITLTVTDNENKTVSASLPITVE
ncbi:MAG: hypothetical protein A3H59_01360 [Candidatus Jacksonbacteria bacterium RIFCSPLOWO2_02_FULL_43_9]|nr:MAG: hypothetical protein A3B94_00900 [Candidatus Jacksonbacteria bacterium RIFCSPHIGHO2_02_FULL_43_10]OGY70813.1 MAG: hypothetical protein A2986_00495 [Candidatus Jacksonbacteria bacterium RIFCSPLOWO2_01_FULL_44_13]OGY73555.1 MAG: hypothetical protein A3H59_01360 [Candidatus Jacksonbacteria bacterium RIFCSPLOWO2_02_FULL_43_9]HAZ17106.1 hypothetical protein [Candidatus Jacksonbacteria bacterium]